MQQQAKIFLAEERTVTETEWFRSYNTFNFGSFYNQYKTPVEKLYVCNDETLAGGKNFLLTVEEDTMLVLLPLVGTVNFIKDESAAIPVNSGEVFCIFLNAGEQFELVNPYPNELINFLQLWIKTEENNNLLTHLHSFNIDGSKNNLLTINLPVPVSIAKLDGRKEITYKPLKENSCVFAFAIQGAFETEGILMHPRDGVAFWNYKQLEMEALSNDAIIFLLGL